MSFVDQVAQKFAAQLKGASSPEIAFREKAWANYVRQGLPDRKNESWKYSSLSPLNFNWAEPTEVVTPLEAVQIAREWKSDFDIALMVNGHLRMNESSLTLEAGYELSKFSATQIDLDQGDGFSSAMAATHGGGFQLRVAPGLKISRPLMIIHCQQGEGAWTSSLNSVVLGQGSQFQLLEVFVGNSEKYLHTDLAYADVASEAKLTWVRVQEESGASSYFGEMQIQLAEAAQLLAHQVHLGAGWTRGALRVNLTGERSEAKMYGLSFGQNDQHVDQRVEMNHLAPKSLSVQLFKGILKDRARGVLNGKIYIAKNAQGVNSSQLNHNLLLSPGAEADTKPELEIFADDVKANHGASVGRMDQDKLFYLLSRAIPRAEAEQMLAKSFISDVIMKIESPVLRSFVNARVEARLPDFSETK